MPCSTYIRLSDPGFFLRQSPQHFPLNYQSIQPPPASYKFRHQTPLYILQGYRQQPEQEKEDNSVVTYVRHCATESLMKSTGFSFRDNFSSKEDEESYDSLYDTYYTAAPCI